MCRNLLVAVTVMGAACVPSFAQVQQRARIVGGGNNMGGRCTMEVVVDGAAEIDLRGDTANLRDLNGRPPQVRRFECTGAMPPNPGDFRFRGVDGRGRQTLVRDPRNGGVATVRIEDPEGGAEAYTFEILWGGGRGEGYGPGPGYGQGRYGDRDRMAGWDEARVIRECQQAIRREAGDRYGSSNVEFRDARIDPDHDFVRGRVDVIRGFGREDHMVFSCALNRETGQVRTVRIDQAAGGGFVPGGRGAAPNRAMENCQRAVTERLRTQGYGRVEIGRLNVDDRPGRSDYIVGDVKGMHGSVSDFYNFACSVDLRDGDVRSVDVTRR